MRPPRRCGLNREPLLERGSFFGIRDSISGASLRRVAPVCAPAPMQTVFYTITMHIDILAMQGACQIVPLRGLSDALTVSAFIVALLLVGSGNAWAIGNAPDLGEASEECAYLLSTGQAASTS